MNMETLEKAEKILCMSIDEINSKGDLNGAALEYLGKAIDAVKDIQEIKKHTGDSYERYMKDGYEARRRDSLGRFMDDGKYGYEEYRRREM